MRFYWANDVEDYHFGEGLYNWFPINYTFPYLCIYLQSELDAYVAKHHNKQVGFLMAERYLRSEVQPMVKGEVLLAKEYP